MERLTRRTIWSNYDRLKITRTWDIFASCRKLYRKITEFLVYSRYVVAPEDSSMFVKHNCGWIIVLLIYIDDLIITGDDLDEITLIRESLLVKFEMKELGELKHFLGQEV